MPERIRTQKPAPAKQEQASAELTKACTEERDKKLAELDALLDDIDEVLEENAAEFVAAYVQKGGQ